VRVIFLFLSLITLSAYAGTAIVSWTPPTTNTDGSAIPATGPGSLSSIRVEWGTCSGTLFGTKIGEVSTSPSFTSVEVTGLAAGLHCFRAFAKNTYGQESAASNVASKDVPLENVAPVIQAQSNRSTVKGTAVDYQVVATDANNDTITFTATNVPPGIVFNSSGLFSGSPTTVGVYNVSVTAKDPGNLSDTKTFTWTITNPTIPNPPVITVETFVYEYNTRRLGKLVASVELGVTCGNLVNTYNGKKYYEVNPQYVTITNKTRANRFMVACG
jgi:hypothetical protein